MSRVLVVGAGLYGATMARELTDAGHHVLVLERRTHIGGNAFTRWNDETACHEHVYGAHIFHTSNPVVWEYVQRFATFNSYRHRVRAMSSGVLYSFPINLMTLHQVFGSATPEEGAEAMAADCIPCDEISNMEQHCLATIGETLYRLFIEGYSKKQWGCEPRHLPASTIKRIPVRLDHNDRYFNDKWEGIPVDGYTDMIRLMLTGVAVETDTDMLEARDNWVSQWDAVVYSGSLDEFYSYRLGRLPYRSLRFETRILDDNDVQGIAVINECDYPFPSCTRTIEHKHFMEVPPQVRRTLLTIEIPASAGEPFYPIRSDESDRLLERYRKLAEQEHPTVVFGGRLGQYRYLDMHQVIASALAKSRELMERLR